MSAAEKAVTIRSSSFLQPSHPLDRPVKYELTAFDRCMRFALYQKRVLFFGSRSFDAEEGFGNLVISLKSSLSEVLFHFHPLCGRMRSGISPVLELDCSGELSVRFSEAETDVSLDELRSTNFEPSAFNDSLCDLGCSPKYPWDPETPLLFVQVTRFSCGGVAVGIAFSHQACDGVSAWRFMNSWAEVARTGKLSSFHPEISYSYKEWNHLSDEQLNDFAQKAGLFFRLKPVSDVKPATVSQIGIRPESGKLAVKHYKVDRGAIGELRKQAMAESSKSFSSYELLCAHFWTKMLSVRNLDDDDVCYFLVLLNCRGRIIKSIPEAYFGNAIGSAIAMAKFGDLMKKQERLSFTAQLIHEVIVSFDEDTANGSTAFQDRFISSGQMAKMDFPKKAGVFTMVVSSPRHPVYECDFGFGRPDGVTFGTNDLGDAKLYLFPPADGAGGVDVTLSMAADAIEKLDK